MNGNPFQTSLPELGFKGFGSHRNMLSLGHSTLCVDSFPSHHIALHYSQITCGDSIGCLEEHFKGGGIEAFTTLRVSIFWTTLLNSGRSSIIRKTYTWIGTRMMPCLHFSQLRLNPKSTQLCKWSKDSDVNISLNLVLYINNQNIDSHTTLLLVIPNKTVLTNHLIGWELLYSMVHRAFAPTKETKFLLH